jgi:hypothetical protein
VGKKVRKVHQKHYKAGTFGIEIEMICTAENEDPEHWELIDHIMHGSIWGLRQEAHDDWHNSGEYYDVAPEYTDIDDWEYDNDQPVTVEDWEYDNPEPEEPERDNYSEDDDGQEEYDDAHNDWEDEYSSWESEKQEVDDEWEEWNNRKEEIESQIEDWDEDTEFERYLDNVWIYDNHEQAVESYREDNEGEASAEDAIAAIKKIIKKHDFEVYGWDANGTQWGVGTDGTDYSGRTVVEIRSGIMTLKDMGKLRAFLAELREWMNKDYDIDTHGETGIHIHIGGPYLWKNKQTWEYDWFNTMAIVLAVDQETIEQEQEGMDRNYASWAPLKKNFKTTLMQNATKHFANKNKIPDSFVPLSDTLWTKERAEENHPVDAFHSTEVINNATLKGIIPKQGGGTRLGTTHGTVEFRHFTSTLLMQEGPDRLLTYIHYLLTLGPSVQNRQQIKVEHPRNDNITLVFTRIGPDQIRMDLQYKNTNRIPLSGKKSTELKAPMDKTKRQLEVPFQKWWRELSAAERDRYTAQHRDRVNFKIPQTVTGAEKENVEEKPKSADPSRAN